MLLSLNLNVVNTEKPQQQNNTATSKTTSGKGLCPTNAHGDSKTILITILKKRQAETKNINSPAKTYPFHISAAPGKNSPRIFLINL
jgi:hypothetical protein